MKKFLFSTLFILSFVACFGQLERSVGFKTGLCFSHFQGPKLAGETWKNFTGFQIGATYAINFTDNFGVRGEFLYAKKGGKMRYDGDGYFIFRTENGTKIPATGKSVWLVDVNNSYLELPVLFFARYGKFEISAGPSISALIGSAADGVLTFNGKTFGNTPVNNFTTRLQYDFRKDDAAKGSGDVQNLPLDGQSTQTPVLGAYQQDDKKNGPLYKTIDFGLNVGMNIYLNNSLYLGGRLNYGLLDVTNNDADRDLSTLDAGQKAVYRADFDRNYSLQLSVGFSF
jgi:Outer membrane protein beta-barrel domain